MPEVFIVYDSGIDLIVKPDSYSDRPASVYKDQIAEGIPGTITNISGTTVFAVDRGSHSVSGVSVQSVPSVSMVLGSVEVTLIADSDGVTLDDLMSAAQTIIKSQVATAG